MEHSLTYTYSINQQKKIKIVGKLSHPSTLHNQPTVLTYSGGVRIWIKGKNYLHKYIYVHLKKKKIQKAAKKYQKRKKKKRKRKKKEESYKYTIKKRIYKQWEGLLNVSSQTWDPPKRVLTKEARSWYSDFSTSSKVRILRSFHIYHIKHNWVKFQTLDECFSNQSFHPKRSPITLLGKTHEISKDLNTIHHS